MPTAKLSQTINSPVEAVFQTVTDVTTFPQWSPTTKAVRRLTEGAIGNGTRFEISVAGFGKLEMVLEEYQENKQVRLVLVSKMIAGGHRFIFSPQGDKTRLDHEAEINGKGIFKLLTPIMGIMGRKNLRELTAALEAYMEK